MKRTGLAVLVFAVGIVVGACHPQPSADNAETKATVVFDPAPPVVGETGLAITLTDAAGAPVRLGHLDVEADMNHAGMMPVFTRLDETDPGQYRGSVKFTMGGDWILLLTGARADGSKLEKKIDVPGVRAK